MTARTALPSDRRACLDVAGPSSWSASPPPDAADSGWLDARASETSRLEAELTRIQADALPLQLQPHFLFNTMQLVAELVHRDMPTALRTLVNLRDLLRQSIANLARREVTVADEVAFLRAYIDIQRNRFSSRLDVALTASCDVARASDDDQ